MSTMNISLPEEMKKYVEDRVAAGQYGTASEYFRELVRQDQQHAADRELAEKLLEGHRSGKLIKGDAAFWEKRKAILAARIAKNSR
jgi:antitoxin ParD1/3/4